MLQQLVTFNVYDWAIYCFAFAVFLWRWLTTTQINSTLVSLCITFTLAGLGMKFTFWVVSLYNGDTAMMINQLGLGVIYFFATGLIFKMHVFLKVPYSMITKLCFVTHFILFCLHSACFLLVFQFQQLHLQQSFAEGIAIIKTLNNTGIMLFTLSAIILRLIPQHKQETVQWRL